MDFMTTVIFDMDGVIIDSEPIHHKIEKEIFSELGLQITDEQHKRYTGTASIEMWTEITETHQLDVSPVDVTRLNHERYLSYIKNLKMLPVVDGVVDLVHNLHKYQKKLVLASSSAREQIEFVLDKLNILDYFPHIVSGAELPKSKPDPMIFLKAAHLSDSKPVQCIVIEDSHHGVTAAKAAGMKCIGFRNPQSGNQDLSQADFIVSGIRLLSIDELFTDLFL